jgi:hypothetical protein
MPERADVLQVRLGLVMQGFGHGTQNVRRLVDPASLLARAGKDLAQRRPEPERTIADGGVTSGLEIRLAPAP